MRLAQALVESLRKAKIIIPGVPVLERLCAEVIVRAQRRLYRQLTTHLSEDHKNKLEALLNVREGSRQTVLAWLPQPDGAPSARNLLGHLERLQALRQVGLPVEIGRTVHQNHLLRLAREGAQTTVYHLKDFEVERHQATLVAILLDTQSTLIDEILDLHDRMVGSAFAKAKRAYETSFQERRASESKNCWRRGTGTSDSFDRGSFRPWLPQEMRARARYFFFRGAQDPGPGENHASGVRQTRIGATR
jgi:hypothetical protein